MKPERILQISKNRLNGNVNFSGIPLWYDIPSKRVLEARGMSRWKLGWELPDEFMNMPEMDGEEDIEF